MKDPSIISLLDIDGALETSRFLEDGFYQFNAGAQENLKEIMELLQPEIVLTTTHRVNYALDEWRLIFQFRGIEISKISKINEAMEHNKRHIHNL